MSISVVVLNVFMRIHLLIHKLAYSLFTFLHKNDHFIYTTLENICDSLL